MIEEGKAYKRISPYPDRYPPTYIYVDKIYFRSKPDNSNIINRIRFVGFTKTPDSNFNRPNCETIEITYPMRYGYEYEEIPMLRFLRVITGGPDQDYPPSEDMLEYK